MTRRYIVPTQEAYLGASNPVSQPQVNVSEPQRMSPYGGMPPPMTQQVTVTFPWADDRVTNPIRRDGLNPLPSYFRPTTTVIPSSKEVMDNAGVPIGLSITPSQVANVPVIDYSQSHVPRCSKCASYLSPYTKVLPDNNSYICPMCGQRNTLPSGDVLNTTPLSARQELTNQVYDMKAPRPYIAMPYVTASICIIVDTSIPAIQSGFTAQFLTSVKASVDALPDNTRIALMTTSDTITVFNFRSMSEFVISDLTDMALQFPYVSLLSDCREFFDAAIAQILGRTPTAEGNCYGSALEATERLMSPLGAVVISGIYGPCIYGPHKVPQRQMTSKTSEQELIHLPSGGSCKFYRDISFRLNRAACSVNLFCVSNTYADISVIGVPCGLTGGNCNFYGEFNQDAALKMHTDIFDCLTQDYKYNCTIRLRCTHGIKLIRPQGTFSIQNGDLVSFPILNPHNAVGFELNIEQPLNVKDAIFQMAMLWTTKDMVRMIRVFTFTLPVSGDINLIRSCIDEPSILFYLTKRAVLDSLTTGPASAKANLKKEVTKLVSHSLPLEIFYHISHALSVHDFLAPQHPLGVDGRMAQIITMRQIAIVDLILMIYPRLFAIDTNTGPLPLVNASFGAGAVYLVHMYDKIIIWVSNGASKEYLQNVFQCDSIETLPSQLPQLQTQESQTLMELINKSMEISERYLPVEIIAQGSPRESVFSQIIIDEQSQLHSGLDSWIAEVRPFRN